MAMFGLHAPPTPQGPGPFVVPVVYDNGKGSAATFRYRLLTLDQRRGGPEMEEALNELGADGWLLFAFLPDRTGEADGQLTCLFVQAVGRSNR